MAAYYGGKCLGRCKRPQYLSCYVRSVRTNAVSQLLRSITAKAPREKPKTFPVEHAKGFRQLNSQEIKHGLVALT